MQTNIIKQLTILFFLCFFALTFTGCSNTVTSISDDRLNHIADENTNGYYFDVYSKDSKEKTRNSLIELESFEDSLYFEIENSGQKRQFSVQVFLDYKQTPFIINGTEYDTFLADFEPQTSRVYEFHFKESVDTKYNHTLLVILTAGADILTNEVEYEMTDDYSVALNHVLSFNGNTTLIKSNLDYESTVLVSEQSTGLLINDDIEKGSRAIPERELHVKRNSEFSLQYQVGGYDDCDEAAIIVTIGLNQVLINGQNHILCNTLDGSLVKGTATFTAPEVPGKYEFMGWVVKEPYNVHENEYLPLDSTYRFTLVVE